MIYKKRTFSHLFNPFRLHAIIFGCFLLATLTGCSKAPPRENFDYTAWKELPVMHAGRVMPLDALARTLLRENDLRFSLAGVKTDKTFTDEKKKRVIECTGITTEKRRRYEPAEMLFSWLVEPDVWEFVPFIKAENEALRKLMELPIFTDDGKRLGHVSPHQLNSFFDSARYKEFMEEADRQREASPEKVFPPETKALLEELKHVGDEYTNFLQLSFRPDTASQNRMRFESQFVTVLRSWQNPAFSRSLQAAALPRSVAVMPGRIQSILSGLYRALTPGPGQPPPPLEMLAAQCRLLVDAAQTLHDGVQTHLETLKKDAANPVVARSRQQLGFFVENFAVSSRELMFSLYENGTTLYVVPSLDPAPLDKQRSSHLSLHPWLSLNALRFGDAEGVLRDMPEQQVKDVHLAFTRAEKGWHARDAKAFLEATEALSASIRKLAEDVQTRRETLLPEDRRDAEVLAATAYPLPGQLHLEVYYYKLNPFKAGWLLPFIGMMFFGVCVLLGFAVSSARPGSSAWQILNTARSLFFWAGFVFLAAGVAMIAYGLCLRAWVMSRAPVTNMFETIVFVALTAGIMGMWFTLRPALDPVLRRGWQATALPWTKTAAPRRWLAWLMLPLRLALVGAIVWIFTCRGYGLGEGYNAIHLLPKPALGATIPTLSEIVTWLSGILTLLVLAWWVPRLALTPIAACVPSGCFFQTSAKAAPAADNTPLKMVSQLPLTPPAGIYEKIVARCWFAFATALAVYVISLVPFLFPENFTPNLRNLMPILRDNYWLSVHVMVIVGSYGAGMLAWVFANLSLLVYLFGYYPEIPAAQRKDKMHRRPPEICKTFSDLMYRCIQAATLMLVVGTILGGLWADVSWGRFWSWDRKEVWALITLFIYLAILHGRYVRLLGEFTLAIGSVLGALAIIMAWYGVNFVLGSTLHGYGSGTGGILQFAIVAGVNLALILVAAMRYLISTQGKQRLT